MVDMLAFDDGRSRVHIGHVLEELAALPADSVHCVVTSPPYYSLRDYKGLPDFTFGDGWTGQLGLEPTPELYIDHMVEVFRGVRRVLRPDGTCWLNLGDCYANTGKSGGGAQGARWQGMGGTTDECKGTFKYAPPGLKPKDLMMIPHRVAVALQEPYYTGRIKSSDDRIWLAAMLDAEGCLFIHKRKAGQHNGQGYYRTNDNFGPGVEISNTSLAVIERIHALVGQGSICSQGPEENNRRKQRLYRWNLRTIECREFVREVYPHLVAKQQQARILYGCLPSGERAEAAHAALISLHRTGQSDVDCQEPPSMYEPGWYVRCDIVWSKLNPMPESVTDRPTRAHEYLFLLAKSERYYYDAEALKERAAWPDGPNAPDKIKSPYGQGFTRRADKQAETGLTDPAGPDMTKVGFNDRWNEAKDDGSAPVGRNKRSVWTIATVPYPEAHFATFPPDLVRPCIQAGTSERGACAACGAGGERAVEITRTERTTGGHSPKRASINEGGGESSCLVNNTLPSSVTVGWQPTCDCPPGNSIPATVCDPFLGSGTTLEVAASLGRRGVGIEGNPTYLPLIEKRLRQGVLL